MRRIVGVVILMTLLTPRSSPAIQLHWASGSSALTFLEATRCTLVVQADSLEPRLPAEWRLLWVADSSTVIEPVALTMPSACSAPIAQVATVDAPATSADSAAHLSTAHFCSAEGAASTSARYLLDLPAGSAGRLKVVALDPSDPDSSRVIESGEVVFNGGFPGEYPVVVLRVATIHRSTEFQAIVVGTGLDRTATLSLVARDESWRQPLAVGSRSDNQVSAVASLAAAVPECVLRAESAEGSGSEMVLQAEVPPALPALDPTGSSCQATFLEHKGNFPVGMIQPKDFAFVLGGWTPQGSWTFHLFYIRQNQETKDHPQIHFGGIDSTERNIGHAVSNDLDYWPQESIDTTAIVIRPGKFDSKHVWAPSIVLRGLTYYMFYTGVDTLGDQRIGLATSTDLITWTQRDAPVFDFADLGRWASPELPTQPWNGEAQFRDPFVMADPVTPGQWLMYFVTIPADHPTALEVGVATSTGDFTHWFNDHGLPSTLHPFGARIAESPHAFFYQGRWWLFYTANHLDVWGISHPSNPADPDSSHWTATRHLNNMVIDEATGLPSNAYDYWKGSEFLQVNTTNDVAYLAAYNDQSVGISYIPVQLAQTPYLFKEHCPVSAAGVDPSTDGPRELRLRLAGGIPSRLPVSLRVELPMASNGRLAIYDVAGRRVRTLHDGELVRGTSAFTWDGRDEAGSTSGSGIYFARFQTRAGERTERMVIIR